MSFFGENYYDKFDVTVPANAFKAEVMERNEWLMNHPDDPEKAYDPDDIDFRLRTIKQMTGAVAKEQKLSKDVYLDHDKSWMPESINHKKYDLRQIRSCFVQQAKTVKDATLTKFNENMAFLCDYDAGNLSQLVEAKPYIGKLIEVIQNGPLLHQNKGVTQEQMYAKLKKSDPELLDAFIGLCNSTVEVIKSEYARYNYAKEGWTAENIKKFTENYNIGNIISYAETLANAKSLGKLEDYSNDEFSSSIMDTNGSSLKEAVEVVSREGSALHNGWHPDDTIMFAVISTMYNHTQQNEWKYKDVVPVLYSKNPIDNVAEFNKWVEKDNDVKDAIKKLSPDAKKRREARLQEEKAQSDAKEEYESNKIKLNKERDKELDNEIAKKREAEENKAQAEKTLIESRAFKKNNEDNLQIPRGSITHLKEYSSSRIISKRLLIPLMHVKRQ